MDTRDLLVEVGRRRLVGGQEEREDREDREDMIIDFALEFVGQTLAHLSLRPAAMGLRPRANVQLGCGVVLARRRGTARGC